MRAAIVVACIAMALPALAGCLNANGISPASATSSTSIGSGSGAQLSADGTPMGNGSMGNMTNNTMNPEHMPHIHNYWAGRTRVVIADEDVQLDPFNTFNNAYEWNSADVGGAYFQLKQGTTVYEGTGQMVVTATWTSTVTGLAFTYEDPIMNQWATPQALQNGQALTMPISAAQCDLPHSGASRWQFYFKAGGTPSAALGSFHLKMEIVRVRDLMLFPAHPDVFHGKNSLLLMDDDTTSYNEGFTTGLTNFATKTQSHPQGFTLPKGHIVAPGTTVLEVQIKPLDSTSGLSGLYLYYRSTQRNFDTAQSLESNTTGVFNFRIDVKSTDVDSYYANSSQWTFYTYPRYSFNGATPSPTALVQSCGGCTDQTMKIHATITAFQVNPFRDNQSTNATA
ncbi:MAG: hypothetical protein ACYDDF_00535 [Thermoplasmatota archaeon]